MLTLLTTRDEISRALAQIGRHRLVDHQPDQTGRCPACGEICPYWIQAVRALRSAGWHLAMVQPHEPARPSWECRPCGDVWPCSQARVMLGDRHDTDTLRADLARLMGHRMALAAAELGVPETELRLRFVGWV